MLGSRFSSGPFLLRIDSLHPKPCALSHRFCRGNRVYSAIVRSGHSADDTLRTLNNHFTEVSVA